MQSITLLQLFKNRNGKITPKTHNHTNVTNGISSITMPKGKRLTAIAKVVELKMYLNSTILVAVMPAKGISYAQLTFDFSIFGISGSTMQVVSADIFSMINPVLLLAISSTVHTMTVQFSLGHKFQL